MAIADKLERLNETKKELATVANKHGGEITDATPFREYAGVFDGVIRERETEINNAKQNAMAEFIGHKTSIEGLFRNGDFETLEDFHKWINYGVTKGRGFSIFQHLYYYCTKAKEVPLLDSSAVTHFSSCFCGCAMLEKIPAYDFRSCTLANSTFQYCSKLKEIWIKNIKCALQVASGKVWGHLLTVESLIHLIYELRDTGKLLTLTVGNVNLEKLENIYVRIIDITDEMRAADDLIDEKLPFEVCESTDEGAIFYQDYMLLKNWQIG